MPVPNATRPSTLLSRRSLLLIALVVAVELVYLFVVSAGTFTRWPTYISYFDALAEGFRAGHLHLSYSPPPELVAKADPFDPANSSLWAPDASYYKGRYYLYWGPVPALILAAVKTVFRIKAFVGDQYLIFGFYTLQLVFGTLLLERLSRRLFDGLPLWALALGVLTFAFATPTPHSLATGAVYHTAIAAGQCFLLGGVFFAFEAVWAAAGRPAPVGKLLAAGLCFALAIASRISLPPSVLLVSVATAFAARPAGGRTWRTIGRDLFWLGLLPVLALLGLLLYNKLRFESWTDFGGTRQLSSLRYQVSASYLLPNLYSYALRPLVRSCHFPYLTAPMSMGERAFPKGMAMPPHYYAAEPVAGVLIAHPIAWLGVVALGAAFLGWRRARAGAAPLDVPDDRRRSFLWAIAAALVLCTNSAFPLLVLFMPSMRQLAELSTGLVLLGTLGGWWLLDRCRGRTWRRYAAATVVTGLAAATIVIGLLLGYEGYNKHFRTYNPALDERMTKALSLCGS